MTSFDDITKLFAIDMEAYYAPYSPFSSLRSSFKR